MLNYSNYVIIFLLEQHLLSRRVQLQPDLQSWAGHQLQDLLPTGKRPAVVRGTRFVYIFVYIFVYVFLGQGAGQQRVRYAAQLSVRPERSGGYAPLQ